MRSGTCRGFDSLGSLIAKSNYTRKLAEAATRICMLKNLQKIVWNFHSLFTADSKLKNYLALHSFILSSLPPEDETNTEKLCCKTVPVVAK